MARRFLFSPNRSKTVKFREASFDILSDFLVNLNKRNKYKLNNLSKCSGQFKDTRLIEYMFLLTEEFRLDPLVGYHATELLERFMIKLLKELFTTPAPQGAAAGQPRNNADHVFDKLKEKFPLIVFSCVQLASKVALHSNIVNNDAAVRFLMSAGLSVSKKAILDSELTILKGLEFRLNAPNPLTHVEILLEVLGHNESSVPVECLYDLCCHVLQFVSLQKTAIYESLLMVTTQCARPSREQREKFITVTEDFMLLGVGVIAVAAYIFSVSKWAQIMEEMSRITGISQKSIRDFTHVTLMHITRTSSPVTAT
ncbi:hypothetical protein LDENG_00115880 [Lucifuga dentata]|nr:hypothetical protein LDENG_00115880 [Lucifuga dentata]